MPVFCYCKNTIQYYMLVHKQLVVVRIKFIAIHELTSHQHRVLGSSKMSEWISVSRQHSISAFNSLCQQHSAKQLICTVKGIRTDAKVSLCRFSVFCILKNIYIQCLRHATCSLVLLCVLMSLYRILCFEIDRFTSIERVRVAVLNDSRLTLLARFIFGALWYCSKKYIAHSYKRTLAQPVFDSAHIICIRHWHRLKHFVRLNIMVFNKSFTAATDYGWYFCFSPKLSTSFSILIPSGLGTHNRLQPVIKLFVCIMNEIPA